MILTSDHLTVIRAGLQFWIEEMGPHDVDLVRGYLDDVVAVEALAPAAITELRLQLQRCELKPAQLDRSTGWLLAFDVTEVSPTTPPTNAKVSFDNSVAVTILV